MTQKGRLLRNGVLLLLVLLLALVFTAPASLVREVIPAQAQVNLSGFQGQLISGGAQNLTVGPVRYDNLRWQLEPGALITGALAASLSVADPKAELAASVRLSDPTHWQINGLSGELQVAHLGEYSNLLKWFNPDGVLTLDEVYLSQDAQAFAEANGKLVWKNARMNANGIGMDLGNISGQLSRLDDRAQLQFKSDSALAAQGTILFAPDGSYEFKVNIDPYGLPANANWLANMGRRQADGMIRYEMQGRLR